MGKLLILNAPQELDYETYDDLPLKPDEVRLKTIYSGISSGTEMTFYRGTNPYLNKRWDTTTKLFLPGEDSTFTFPVRNLGYEEVGEVIEIGAAITDIAVGAHVFGTWGHRTLHVATADYVRPRLMPAGLDPICGIFSHLGAIALNGVFDSGVKLGETIAIFGMGALGQVVAQAAQQSGGNVIAIDLHDSRLEMAKNQGAWLTINPRHEKVAETIKQLTNGRGADVCIEVSGAPLALHEAIRTVAYSGRVVVMGFIQGEAKGLLLGEEFHHNRINLVCSQISGLAPEFSNRWDKLRLWQTAIRLQAEGKLDLRSLITHTAPFEEAHQLFEALDQTPDQVVQAVLEF